MSEQSHSPQTAPIDEYRVLWTTQKKQKLKKWHDGFLRFHKFNKRMLVYDDARHLVADMYLRGRDAIAEGDDLEFEHHLVTIEDFKGTVVQDLAPLFSPAVQRKQQLQAGNALLNSTPNQANRHGPWGPSRHATKTPQPTQQQRPIATTGLSPMPVQRRPTNTLKMSLQQSIRANNNINHPSPYQDRSSRPVKPLNFPANIPTRMEPRKRPNKISGLSPLTSDPPQRSDQLQYQERPQNQTKEQSQPGSNLVAIVYDSNGPPFDVSSDPLSLSRRSNRSQSPPTTPLQRLSRQNNMPSYPATFANQGSITALDLDSFSDSIRLSPDMKSPLPYGGPTSLPSHHILPHENKDTLNRAIGVGSGELLSRPPHDPSILVFPQPPWKGCIPTGSAPIHARKRSLAALSADNDPRTYRPPSKRKTVILPKNLQQRSSGAVIEGVDINFGTVSDLDEDSNPHAFQYSSIKNAITLHKKLPRVVSGVNTNDIVSGSSEDSEKEPSEVLLGAGTLLLGNTTKRKRNKLLCQQPLNTYAPAPLPVIKKKMNDFKFQAPKRATIHSRDSDKGKGKVSSTLAQEYRIEAEDTVEYQKENDIGPWSSEAFDLFDWRPPNMVGRK